MVNYACGFSQSEKEKYFESTINLFNTLESGCLNFYLSTCKVIISVNKILINQRLCYISWLCFFGELVKQSVGHTKDYTKISL